MLAYDHKKLFIHYLKQLKSLLKKLEQQDSQDLSLLDKRLNDDMFPLGTQVKITANFALRACCNSIGAQLNKL